MVAFPLLRLWVLTLMLVASCGSMAVAPWTRGVPRSGGLQDEYHALAAQGHRSSRGASLVGARLSLRLRGGKEMEAQAAAETDTVGGGEGGGLQMPMLRNILDFSTRLTNTSSGGAPPPPPVIDPERMAFLQQALTSMVENTTDVFRSSISCLTLEEADEQDRKRKHEALAVLADRVEQLDLAQGLHNLGGFAPVIECLGSSYTEIRQGACDVVASCVQNNAPVQMAAMELGALPRLMDIYANRSLSAEERTKALAALSGLVRGNSTSELEFLQRSGLQMLRADMLLAEVRLRRKAIFTLGQLMASNPALRVAVLRIQSDEAGRSKGILPEIVSQIQFPDIQVSDFACMALRTLMADSWVGAGSSGVDVREQFPELEGVLQAKLEFLLKEADGHDTDDVILIRDLLRMLSSTEGHVGAAQQGEVAGAEQGGGLRSGDSPSREGREPPKLLGPSHPLDARHNR